MNEAEQKELPQEYCAGFLFGPYLADVALIRKAKPAWQRGKLNGIGGKVEPGETPHDAMVREFEEEAGVRVPRWTLIRTERFEAAVVHFFAALASHSQWGDIDTKTEEEVTKVFLGAEDELLAGYSVMYNLPYLIPMARILLAMPPSSRPAP